MIGRRQIIYASILLFAMMLALLASATWAGGDCNGPGACESTEIDASTIVETVIGGNDNLSIGLALSYGMGDVDINEGQNCMGSEQGANVLWGSQKLVLSPWCAALFYEVNGKHKRAAVMRCLIPKVRGSYPYYGDEMACINGENLGLQDDAVSIIEKAIKEHREIERQHGEELAQAQMNHARLVSRFEELATQLAGTQEQLKVSQSRSHAAVMAAATPEPQLSVKEKYAILELWVGKADGNE